MTEGHGLVFEPVRHIVIITPGLAPDPQPTQIPSDICGRLKQGCFLEPIRFLRFCAFCAMVSTYLEGVHAHPTICGNRSVQYV